MGKETKPYDTNKKIEEDTLIVGAELISTMMNAMWAAVSIVSAVWFAFILVNGQFSVHHLILGLIFPIVGLKIIQVVVDKCFWEKGKVLNTTAVVIWMSIYLLLIFSHPSGVIALDALAFGIMVVFPVFGRKNLVFAQTGIIVALVAARHVLVALRGGSGYETHYVLNTVALVCAGFVIFIGAKFIHERTLVLGNASRMDSLTGLYNHESFYEELEDRMKRFNEIPANLQEDEIFSILIADIDSFKKVNDTYGHAYGDQVIEAIASIFIRYTGTGDFAARYGGEEFAFIMANTNKGDALTKANNIRKQFAATIILDADGNPHQFTCSIGVAQFTGGDMTSSEFFDTADQALYEAKRTGKNRVCSA